MTHLVKLLRRLYRRGVLQALGLYLVAGFAVLEAVELAAPRLALPDGLVTAVLVALLVGLPLVAVLAWRYDLTSDGIVRSLSEAPEPPEARGSRTAAVRPRLRWALPVGLVALIAVGALAINRTTSSPPVEPTSLAVLPFNVAASQLDYLREGLMDLLITKLADPRGAGVVSAGTVLAEWRDLADEKRLTPAEVRGLGERLGAGKVLTGSVVAIGSEVTLTVEVLEVVTGERGGSVAITGPADSLLRLVDRLAAEVLALEAGHQSYRLATLSSVPLPALKAYLEGRRLLREGRYGDATARLREAVDLDSTFALAATSLATASRWFQRGDDFETGTRLAWRYRDRLPARDRAMAVARGMIGEGRGASMPDIVAAWERAVELAPHEPEAWYGVGDAYWHWGHTGGVPDAMERARDGFARALETDSLFGPALRHLIETKVILQDNVGLRALVDRQIRAMEDTAAIVDLMWLGAVVLGDSARLRLAEQWLHRTPMTGHLTTVGMAARLPPQVLRGAIDRILSGTPRATGAMVNLAYLEMFAGRPTRARQALDRLEAAGANPFIARLNHGFALGGDSVDAAETLRYLDAAARSGARDSDGEEMRRAALLLRALQRLERGDTTGAAAAVRGAAAPFQGQPADSLPDAWLLHPLRLTVDAWLAVADHAPDAADRVARLDSLGLYYPVRGPSANFTNRWATLFAARLWGALGEPHRGLEAARRLSWDVRSLSAAWLLRARFAARLGLRDEAIEFYRHFLAYRDDPGPGTPAEAAARAARSELAALVGEVP